MNVPVAVSAPARSLSFPVSITAPPSTFATPPSVITAPISAPISTPSTDYPSASTKPAFVPLDGCVEPNALQMFVQKMKIHEDRKIEGNLTGNTKPLPLRMDGGNGSVAPSSESPSPTSPLPEKPLSTTISVPLLTPDAFERPPLLANGAAKRGKSWNSSSTNKVGGGVSKMAATLIRDSFVLTSDEDVPLDDFEDDDSEDGGIGGDEGREAVAGLTKEQLRATLIHLLQSDNDFLETIHAGYINCLKTPRRNGVGKR